MASSQFNTTRELKRESISYMLSNYTKTNDYYALPVPNTHNYILAELVDWYNTSAEPFTIVHNGDKNRIYVITGTREPSREPSRVDFYLWYYE